jgi:hypothetical protein
MCLSGATCMNESTNNNKSVTVKIPFKERFREPLLNQTKDWTTRTKQYGKPYDYFEAFGAGFRIDDIMQLPLKTVIANWKREGCFSEQDFIDVWKSIHPTRKFDLEETFYTHSFHRVGQRRA